jgi:hypothetical protein
MVSIKKIAFCTDFSENADQAFDQAFDLAKGIGSWASRGT